MYNQFPKENKVVFIIITIIVIVIIISNGNRIEWSAIQGVMGRVI